MYKQGSVTPSEGTFPSMERGHARSKIDVDYIGA